MDLSVLTLTTDRLRLSAYCEADAAGIHAYVTPTMTRYLSFDPLESVDELIALDHVWVEHSRAGTEVAVTVRQIDNGSFVEMAGLHYCDDPEPEVGIWIREGFHGRGFGKEAIAALAHFTGDVLGEAAVIYLVVDANTCSRRIAEGLGGTIIDHRVLHKPSGLKQPLVVYRIATS